MKARPVGYGHAVEPARSIPHRGKGSHLKRNIHGSRPELTAEKFPRRDGLFPWLRTGDFGRVDADGYV